MAGCDLLKRCALGLFFGGLILATQAAQTTNRAPNILFIIADDCTYTDMEVYGGQATTPNLVRLASEGMKFNRCFQAAPMCSPTRHCIYTGLYPVRSGAYPNHTFVKPGTKSIAHYLGDAGYRVALSGKTHINPPESFPFEYSDDKKNGGGNNPNLKVVDRMFEECVETKQPFALFACSNEPHGPYTRGDASAYPPEEVVFPPHYVDTPETRSEFSKYLAEITYFDWQVGELVKLLEKHGLAENTMVMVVSEQGNAFPFAKWTCYDAGLQSGMIVRWPGKVDAGRVNDAMVEYVDIAQTFMDAAGVAEPTGEDRLDGRSFLPVLLGQSDQHKEFTFGLHTTVGIINGSEHYGIRTVRGNGFRYVRNLTPDIQFRNIVYREPYWKEWEAAAQAGDVHAVEFVRRYGWRPSEELFDSINDPWNLTNLVNEPRFVEVKERLSDELDAWMKQQGDLGEETEVNAVNRLWKNRNNSR